MAKEINDNEEKLKAFIRSDDEVKRSVEWLERVKIRMTSPDDVPETENDRKYLSRFEYTKTCKGETAVTKWIEWIEPLTVHTRHPFAYLHPVPKPGSDESVLNADYVLFASASHLKSSRQHKAKSFFIDAGEQTAKYLFNLETHV